MTVNPNIVKAYFKEMGLPECIDEYRFHTKRRWRFDYAFPARKVAIELDGGIWTGGRHVRGKGRKGDMEKMTAAAVLGWRVLYFEPSEIFMKDTIDQIKEALSV